MKSFFTLGAIVTVCFANAQHSGRVGINTETPNATLDVRSNANDNRATDGFIPPKLTGVQLKAKDALYTQNQIGAIVFITEGLANNATTTKTVKVTTRGFYYFDGSIWQKMDIDTDTNIYANDGSLPSNREVSLNGNRLHMKGRGILVVGGENNSTNVNTNASLNVIGSANINNDIYAPNLPSGANTDQVLVLGGDNRVKKINASSLNTDTNIYTNNGTLPNNREVSLNGNRLHMKGRGILVVGGDDNSTNVNTSASLNVIGSANINNDIYAPNLPSGANTDQVLVLGGDNRVKKINASSLNTDTNIYTNNGTLTGNRVVTMGNHSLSFDGNLTSFIREGESLSIKPSSSGQSNFIGFYKNGKDSNRTAYIGYGSAGNNNFTIANTAGGNISLDNNSKVTGTLEVTNMPNIPIQTLAPNKIRILAADTDNDIVKHITLPEIKDNVQKISVQELEKGGTLDLSNIESKDLKDLYIADSGIITLPSCTRSYSGKVVSIYLWGGASGTLIVRTNSNIGVGGVFNPGNTNNFSFPAGVSYDTNQKGISFNKGNISNVGFRNIRFFCLNSATGNNNWFPDLRL